MTHIEHPLSFLDSEEAILRVVESAAAINIDNCPPFTEMTKIQYLAWLAENPRRPINLSRLDREGQRMVLFGIDG